MPTHSTLQLFGILSPAVESALAASIQRFGVLVPIAMDQHGRTIDGHHRARIAGELGVPYRIDVIRVRDDDEAREIARTLNADRRHLTSEQIRDVAIALRQDGHSIRGIAGALGVPRTNIEREVSGVPSGTPERTKGIDGKSYPSTRPVLVPTLNSRDAATVGESMVNNENYAPKVAKALWEPTHVSHNSGENEWYTPPEIIEAARLAMGGIDCDPASSAVANETVRASQFFTIEDDGLAQVWRGRVWMNPPYSQPLCTQFCDALATRFRDGEVTEAIALVNNATETVWFRRLVEEASGIVFPSTRVRFQTASGEKGAPLQGQALIYLGTEPGAFFAAFRSFGWMAIPS